MAQPVIRFSIDPMVAVVGVRSSTIGSLDREKKGAEAGFKSFPLRLNAFVPEGFLTGRLGGPSAAASAEKCIGVRFSAAGASRVVYLPVDESIGLAFKFARSNYKRDDNQDEWFSNLPDWLIPEKFHFESQTRLLLADEVAPLKHELKYSVLVIERMTSLEECFLALQEELPVRKSVETVVITICRALTLMAQAGASRISTGDWKLSNLGYRKEEPNRLRLLDFSGNRLDESLPAYACVKKAWASFLQSIICLGPRNKPPRYQEEWLSFFANLQEFLGQIWWRKGKFTTEESGVPTASNVADLRKLLLSKTATMGADQTPIVASTASFSGLQPRPSQELSKDDLYEWLLSQNINPGEGTWIRHLCSEGAAFAIPKAMKGIGLRDRVRNWLMTLDGFKVYQDEGKNGRSKPCLRRSGGLPENVVEEEHYNPVARKTPLKRRPHRVVLPIRSLRMVDPVLCCALRL